MIEKDGELIGKTYFELLDNMTGSVIGIWLQQRKWGERISQERADIFMCVLFKLLYISYVEVGCVHNNKQSVQSIEKYISRYGGSFCGSKPTIEASIS